MCSSDLLAALVGSAFSGRLSACLDAMMDELGEGVARDNLQPDSLFDRVARFVATRAVRYPVLVELLLWDYAHYSLLTRKTPPWIAERLEGCERLSVDGTRRRLPVLPISEAAVAIIDRLTMTPLRSGRYAVWPRQHRKGKPVEIVAVEG